MRRAGSPGINMMRSSSKYTAPSSAASSKNRSFERSKNSVKIDRQDEQPNPGRSKEPLGLGSYGTSKDKPDVYSKREPEVFEVENDSDSELEVVYEKKGTNSRKNDVIEVNIDSDSEGESGGIPVTGKVKSEWLGSAATTESSSGSSSGSSSVIQIESDMEEESKSMGDNDVDMVDQDYVNSIADNLWESSYLHDHLSNVMPTDNDVEVTAAPAKTGGAKENNVTTEKEPDVIDAEAVPIGEVAAERKRHGNEYFAKGEYHQALKMYSTAIDLVPTEAAYFGNRSACLLMMNKFKDAAADARAALTLDPNLKNGYIRLARSTLALGDITACELAIASAEAKPDLKLDLNEEKQKLTTLKHLRKEIEASDVKKDFRKTLYLTERAKNISPGDVSLKIKRAETLIKLGRFIEAQEQCTEILQADGMVVEAITLRAYCFYQADNLDKALQYYKEALTRAPDNRSAAVLYKKAKQIKELREKGAENFRNRKWDEAHNAYKQCLDLIEADGEGNAVLASKINFNLALIAGKSSSELSLTFVNKALSLNPKYVKALLHRATIHTEQEKFEEAVRDYEAVEKIEPHTANLRRLIEEAKLSAKKAKRKDYYKILGIDKKASTDEIKKAYKKRALDHHPDRHANATETERRDQEKKFKEVLEAYEILLDDKKRRRYDMGLDINESASSSYEPFDPSAMFGHMFFQHAGMGGMGGRPGGFHQFRAGPGYSGFRR